MRDKTSATGISAVESNLALEVRQSWASALMDVRHFRPGDAEVWLGSRTASRWEVLGVDMGWVESPWDRILPWLLPVWGEVRTVLRDDFASSGAALRGADCHRLCVFDEHDEQWYLDPVGGEREPVTREARSVVVGELRYEVQLVSSERRMAPVATRPDTQLLFSGALTAFAALCFSVVVAVQPPPSSIAAYEVHDAHFEAMLRALPAPPPPQKAKAVEEESTQTEKSASSERQCRVCRQVRGSGGGGPKRVSVDVQGMGMFSEGGLSVLEDLEAPNSDLYAKVGNLKVRHAGIGNGTGIGSLGSRDGWGEGGNGGGPEGLGSFGPVGSGSNGPPGPGLDGTGKSTGIIGGGGLPPIVVGSLPASMVDGVVKRHLSQLRYCYQRQLTRKPNLAGKLSVRFTIAPDGTVSGAKIRSSTLKDGDVESCVVGQFLRMQFPEPKGGGIVNVNYPFLFSPGR